MLRDRLDHAQVRAARQPQRVMAAARERQRALRVGALGGQLAGGLRLEHDRGAADRHAEPAEAPLAVAGDREHAQVQASRRLDAHRRSSAAYSHSQARASALITERTYSIASRSRGSARLVHEHLQPVELGADLLGVEHAARARRGSTPRAPRGSRG